MAFDYGPVIATAATLIADFGRTIKVIKISEAETDSAKPWRGVENPRATPALSVTVKGVFVHPSSAEDFGIKVEDINGLGMKTQVCLVAANVSTESLEDADEIEDEGVTWRIINAVVLRPGDAKIIYMFFVER